MGYSQAERLELSQKAEAARKVMRDVHAEAGANELTEEQNTRYEAAKAEVRSVRAAIARMDEQDRFDAEFAAEQRATSPDNMRPLDQVGAMVNDGGQVEDRMVAAGREFLRKQSHSIAAWGDTAADVVDAADDWTDAECIAASPHYRDAFWRLHAGDTSGAHLVHKISADLQVDNDTQAGIFVAPMQFTAGILKARDQRNVLARDARRISVRNARALGVRKRTSKASTFTWGSELAEPSTDTSLAYGGKELTPHDWSAEARI